MLLLLVLILGGIFSYKLWQIKKKVFVSASTDSITAHLQNKTPFSVLLLGYGGGDHDGANLTDSMIVARVDPGSKKVALISIPRDIWIKIPTNLSGGSHWKINAAFQIGLDDTDYSKKEDRFKGPAGGGNLAKYIVEQVVGFPIDRFVALDFNGFSKTIDSLGGVDVKVEKSFDDYQYPVSGKEDDLCGHNRSEMESLLTQAANFSVNDVFPCRFQHIHFDEGVSHLSGEAALQFVRSRHSLQDGTDFGRSTRQRNLLAAVKEKVFAIGFIPGVLPFIDSLKDDASTDFSISEIKDLLSEAGQFKDYQVANIALSNENVLKDSVSEDGQEILIPDAGVDQWGEVSNWLSSALNPQQEVDSPMIKVENGTDISGLAGLAVNRLRDKDLRVLDPVDASEKSLQQTAITIYNDKVNSQLAADLENEFGIDQVSRAVQSDLSYDILIEVGENYNLIQGKKLIN